MLLICLLGFVLRLYHVLVAEAIAPDGALFIDFAQRLATNPVEAARAYAQHPLFPALILLFHAPWRLLIGEGSQAWILAGQSVAIAGSLASILAAYWFTTRLYGRRRGLIAAAILAVLPDACRFGADVLTDMPHLALYLAGLGALITGLQTHKTRFLLLTSVAGAFAFLTRPEGGAVLLVGLICVLWLGGRSWKKRLATAVGMCAIFFCITAPYQIAVGKLIPKKSPTELLKFGFTTNTAPIPAFESPDQTRGEYAATSLPVPINVLRQWFRSGRVVYVLLAILGVVVARPRGDRALVFGLATGIHLTLMHALEYRYGYLDRRHALILFALTLPLAAEGVWWLSNRIGRRARTSRRSARFRNIAGILAICFVLTAYWLFRPINRGDAHVVAAGRWIAANSAPGAPVVSNSRMRRAALYAERPFIEWRWWGGKVRHLAVCLAEHPDSYFVVNPAYMTSPEQNPNFFEELATRFGDNLVLLHTEKSRRDPNAELRIYRLADQKTTIN